MPGGATGLPLVAEKMRRRFFALEIPVLPAARSTVPRRGSSLSRALAPRPVHLSRRAAPESVDEDMATVSGAAGGGDGYTCTYRSSVMGYSDLRWKDLKTYQVLNSKQQMKACTKFCEAKSETTPPTNRQGRPAPEPAPE